MGRKKKQIPAVVEAPPEVSAVTPTAEGPRVRITRDGGSQQECGRIVERSEEKDSRGRKTNYYVVREALPRIADKRAKCQSFAARFQAKTTHWPRSRPWAHQVIAQLTGFPGHRPDDNYDVCGLLGRGIYKMMEADPPPTPTPKGPEPFTGAWVEYTEPKKGPRYR